MSSQVQVPRRTDAASHIPRARRGLYQLKPVLPFSPGGEVCGVVTELGEGVSGFAVGDRVMALTFYGGFVSRIAVHENQCVKVPDAIRSAHRATS